MYQHFGVFSGVQCVRLISLHADLCDITLKNYVFVCPSQLGWKLDRIILLPINDEAHSLWTCLNSWRGRG